MSCSTHSQALHTVSVNVCFQKEFNDFSTNYFSLFWIYHLDSCDLPTHSAEVRLSVHCMPDSVLGAGDTEMKERAFLLLETYILIEGRWHIDM